ncbi:MAG: biopolymer transporter ExbD [Pseudomonadota bacterium]
MARVTPFRHPEPMSAINVTPFIDVLLVLLIMLILTVPMMSHKLPLDLPRPGKSTAIEEPHRLAIDQAGALYWDGKRIPDARLPALLASTAQGEGVLQMSTDPEARYERFNAILTEIKKAGITRLGFVGNQPLAD